MASRDVPVYPLADYVPPTLAELGIFVGRFEVLNTVFDRPPGMHRHEHFELFWLHGPAVHFNDFEQYALPNDRPSFVFASPGQLHRWEGADDIRGVLISFTHAFFDGHEPPPGRLPGYGFVHRMEFPPVLIADSIFEMEAMPLIERCQSEFTQRQEGWEEILRSALHMLMAMARRAYLRASTPSILPGRSRQLLQRFQTLIEADFRNLSQVFQYAQVLGITPGHLNDTVREGTGGTAGELIRSRQMLEARRLLFHSEQSVSEIAYHLGFEDPSYFAKVFRKATGLSPVSFRKNYRNHRDENRSDVLRSL